MIRYLHSGSSRFLATGFCFELLNLGYTRVTIMASLKAAKDNKK